MLSEYIMSFLKAIGINSLPGVQVHLRLEVQVEAPEGIPERVKQIVKENCRTLGVDNFGFDQE